MSNENKNIPVDRQDIKTYKTKFKDRQDIKDIEKDILSGIPLNTIAKNYNCTRAAVNNYKQRHMSQSVKKYTNQINIQDGKEIWNLLTEYINNVNMVSNSCKMALEHPDDPNLIDVGVQSNDITVTYYQTNAQGKRKKKKAKLQAILDRLDGIEVQNIDIKAPDRIKTLLEASNVMNKHLRLVADLRGMIGNTTINIANQPMFVQFVQGVVMALEGYPEAKQRLITHVRAMSKRPLLDLNPDAMRQGKK